MAQEDALRVLGELGHAADRGIPLEQTELTTNEVYGALLWAMDEVADLKSELESTRDRCADELAAITADLDLAMFELDQPLPDSFPWPEPTLETYQP